MNKKERLYALFVGINHYQNPAVSDLEYAVADVEGLKNFMTARMGLSEDNCISLVNPSSDDLDKIPTRKLLLEYLDKYSKAPMGPDDTFIFYFAGHGYEKNETQYLLAVDSNPDSEELLEDTAVPIPRLRKYLKKVQAGNQLLILDACRNDPHNLERGAGSNRTDGTVMARDIAVIAKDGQKNNLRKFAIITASGEGQVSYEYPNGKHSWFCYHLLECLKNEPGPLVDMLALNEKITQRMQERAWKELPTAGAQLPHITIEGGRFTLPIETNPKVKQGKDEKGENEIKRLIMDVINEKKRVKRFYIFPRSELKLGRSSQENDILTRVYPVGDTKDKNNPNWMISREHLKISYDNENFQLVDINSTSRTFLNGKPVTGDKGVRLSDGDVVNLGGVLNLKVNLFCDEACRHVNALRLRRIENQPEWEEEYIILLKEASIGSKDCNCLRIDWSDLKNPDGWIYLKSGQLFFKNLNNETVFSVNNKKIGVNEEFLLDNDVVVLRKI